MSEQPGKTDEHKDEEVQAQYGSQGNEGLYGQGQYDENGRPDPRTRQAQQLKPDDKPGNSPSKEQPGKQEHQHKPAKHAQPDKQG